MFIRVHNGDFILAASPRMLSRRTHLIDRARRSSILGRLHDGWVDAMVDDGWVDAMVDG